MILLWSDQVHQDDQRMPSIYLYSIDILYRPIRNYPPEPWNHLKVFGGKGAIRDDLGGLGVPTVVL